MERSKSKRVLFWILLILIAALGVSGLLYQWLRPKLPVVTTATVRTQNLKNVIFASGTVKPDSRQVVTTAQLPAPVSHLDVHVGENVKPGQVLLRCENQAQLSSLKTAQQLESNAQQAYDQLQRRIQSNSSQLGKPKQSSNTVEGQVTSALQQQLDASLQSQLQSLKDALDQAKASVETAKLTYQATIIKASIPGTVVTAQPTGIQADGSQGPVVEVAGNGRQVVAGLSEEDAVNIHQGLAVTVTSQAFPGKTWNAKVIQVSPFATAVNSGAGQVQIRVGQLSSNWPVPLGYQVDLHIVSAVHHHVDVVPYSALIQQGTDYAVYVLKHQHVQKVTVTLGITSNDVVEVAKGLHPGDKIVTNPPSDLKNGEKVRTKA